MQIDAKAALAGLYACFQEQPALLNKSDEVTVNAEAEAEAIAALLAWAKDGDMKAWLNARTPAKQTASALLLDFMFKLMGPLSRRVWEVAPGLTPSRQARAVIAQELSRAHPAQTRPQ